MRRDERISLNLGQIAGGFEVLIENISNMHAAFRNRDEGMGMKGNGDGGIWKRGTWCEAGNRETSSH